MHIDFASIKRNVTTGQEEGNLLFQAIYQVLRTGRKKQKSWKFAQGGNRICTKKTQLEKSLQKLIPIETIMRRLKIYHNWKQCGQNRVALYKHSKHAA